MYNAARRKVRFVDLKNGLINRNEANKDKTYRELYILIIYFAKNSSKAILLTY